MVAAALSPTALSERYSACVSTFQDSPPTIDDVVPIQDCRDTQTTVHAKPNKVRYADQRQYQATRDGPTRYAMCELPEEACGSRRPVFNGAHRGKKHDPSKEEGDKPREKHVHQRSRKGPDVSEDANRKTASREEGEYAPDIRSH
jgi:hypothetical protein